jgi:hypothetical protein
MIDLALTDDQATELAPLLADLECVVCIGSIHPRPYVAGMAPADVGRLVARVGTVPKARMLAVRQAALGVIKARPPASLLGRQSAPPPQSRAHAAECVSEPANGV